MKLTRNLCLIDITPKEKTDSGIFIPEKQVEAGGFQSEAVKGKVLMVADGSEEEPTDSSVIGKEVYFKLMGCSTIDYETEEKNLKCALVPFSQIEAIL